MNTNTTKKNFLITNNIDSNPKLLLLYRVIMSLFLEQLQLPHTKFKSHRFYWGVEVSKPLQENRTICMTYGYYCAWFELTQTQDHNCNGTNIVIKMSPKHRLWDFKFEQKACVPEPWAYNRQKEPDKRYYRDALWEVLNLQFMKFDPYQTIKSKYLTFCCYFLVN